MEVPLQDGLYASNIDHVLNYWKTSFSNLYNSREFESRPYVNQNLEGNDLFLVLIFLLLM